MKNKKNNELVKIENFLNYENEIKIEENTFKQLMFLYQSAIKEITTKLEILKDEFKCLYDYDLIDHIDTRIKKPESILKKMKSKEYEITYKNMIENINDIAGIRVICEMKKDIFAIKNLIERIPGLKIIKQKDYITKPKKSGYTSYHMIVEVPVTLSQKVIYVKVEIQIRTLAMDFWANIEHKMKYKPQNGMISDKKSKELVACAKMITKLDNRMMLFNE